MALDNDIRYVEESDLRYLLTLINMTFVKKDGNKVLSSNDFTDVYKAFIDRYKDTGLVGGGSSTGGLTLTPENIKPGAIVVVKDGSTLASTDVTVKDLIAALEKKLEADNKFVPGALLVGADNKVQSSNIKLEELMSTVNKKTEVDGEVVPGALMIGSNDGKLKSSEIPYDALVTALQHKQVQPDWNEKDETSPAFIKNKPTGVDGAVLKEVETILAKKVELAETCQPGALLVADTAGLLVDSGVKPQDLLIRSELIMGAVTATVKAGESGLSVVDIPIEVKGYPVINVYHNGMLLVEGIHYTMSKDIIRLIGFTLYKNELVTFVGVGSTVSGGLTSDTGHTHPNKVVLDTITQEMVDKWESYTPIDTTPFVRTETLFDSQGLILADKLPYKPGEGGGLTLGVTETTAFRGDLGSKAYEHSKEVHAPATAQENIIESVLLGETLALVKDKQVQIPVASETTFGLVKSAVGKNKVTIEADGTMSISDIDFSIITTSETTELVLNGGSSISRR